METEKTEEELHLESLIQERDLLIEEVCKFEDDERYDGSGNQRSYIRELNHEIAVLDKEISQTEYIVKKEAALAEVQA
jgi:hypothetical protein